METLGVIPARYQSTRLAGKALLDIGGKPLVQHVYERAKKSKELEELWIATDDSRIAEAAKGFGAKVIMTSSTHLSGTDRVAEVARQNSVKFIVNIQADEPLVAPAMIDLLVSALKKEGEEVGMASLYRPLRRLADEKDLLSPNVVKVIMDRKGYALYFSRGVIPFHRKSPSFSGTPPYFKHLGFYAYRRDFLLYLTSLEPSPLELTEGLEQLRVLENGGKIRMVKSPFDTVGVDTYEDLERVRKILGKKHA